MRCLKPFSQLFAAIAILGCFAPIAQSGGNPVVLAHPSLTMTSTSTPGTYSFAYNLDTTSSSGGGTFQYSVTLHNSTTNTDYTYLINSSLTLAGSGGTNQGTFQIANVPSGQYSSESETLGGNEQTPIKCQFHIAFD